MTKMSAGTEELFDEIVRFIAESRKLLAAGSMMELAGLDGQVRVLCDAVLQLSPQERQLSAERLEQLLGDLKQLGDEMVASRDKLAEEIRSVSQVKKAHIAYRTVNAVDMANDGDEEE